MRKQLFPAIRMTLVLTVLTGLIYPGVATALCRLFFRHQADGSLIERDGRIVGSSLIGQNFTAPGYFHPRPSSAGENGYDASASSGSNLGPTSARLVNGAIKSNGGGKEVVDFEGIKLRIVHYCIENGLPYESSEPLDSFRDAAGALEDVKLIKAFNNAKSPLLFRPGTPIPADAVTGSGSGLDPDISPANAALQSARVAQARGVSVGEVRRLVDGATEEPSLGILGDRRVNVLKLNLALDAHFRTPPSAAGRHGALREALEPMVLQ